MAGSSQQLLSTLLKGIVGQVLQLNATLPASWLLLPASPNGIISD